MTPSSFRLYDTYDNPKSLSDTRLPVTAPAGPGTYCDSTGDADCFVWSGDGLYLVWPDAKGEGWGGVPVQTSRFQARFGVSAALAKAFIEAFFEDEG